MKVLKNSIISSIIVALAFVFNILVFAPLEIYYTNKKDLWFDPIDIVPSIIFYSVITLIIVIIVAILLKGKKRNVFIKVIFALLTTLYIQGNFLNFGYNIIDGSEINWNQMIVKGVVNVIIWIAIIGLPYCIKPLRKEKKFNIFMTITAICIILIETITLVTLIVTQENKLKVSNGLNNQNIFNLSKDENIIVFMSDTFEGAFMNRILEESPEYKEKLKDFTYFDNCTGVSFYTYSSMPTLLTGVACNVGNSLEENVKYCFENTQLYDVLKENGYKREIYTEVALEPPYKVKLDNQGEKNKNTTLRVKNELTKSMYKYTCFRYLPHFLKSKFEIEMDEFYKIKADNKALYYKENTYYLDDVGFNKELVLKGITSNSSEKMFKFYHTDGLHAPYYTTVDLKYERTEEYLKTPQDTRRYNEAIASLNLLCNYIEELKKTGVYDNTTIIFLADHGYGNRFHTNLLVKKAEDTHDFEISSAPVSLLEDLVPTILNIATDTKDYGKDFFDYQENEKRVRRVYDYTYETGGLVGNRYKVISRIIFETEKEASNKEAFYVVKEEYSNEDKKLTEKYKLGTTIKIEDIEKSKSVNFIGLTLRKVNLDVPKGCNISNNISLKINRQKAEKDVIATFKLEKVYDFKHTINFKINGEKVYSMVIDKNTKEIVFKIPKRIWNSNDELKIDIEFPDARLGTHYPTMMMAVQLGDIKFDV